MKFVYIHVYFLSVPSVNKVFIIIIIIIISLTGTVEHFVILKHVYYDDSNITRTPDIHSGLSKYIRYHS